MPSFLFKSVALSLSSTSLIPVLGLRMEQMKRDMQEKALKMQKEVTQKTYNYYKVNRARVAPNDPGMKDIFFRHTPAQKAELIREVDAAVENSDEGEVMKLFCQFAGDMDQETKKKCFDVVPWLAELK